MEKWDIEIESWTPWNLCIYRHLQRLFHPTLNFYARSDGFPFWHPCLPRWIWRESAGIDPGWEWHGGLWSTRCFSLPSWHAPGKAFPFTGHEATRLGDRQRNLFSVGPPGNWSDKAATAAITFLFFHKTHRAFYTCPLFPCNSCWCCATEELCKRWTTARFARK